MHSAVLSHILGIWHPRRARQNTGQVGAEAQEQGKANLKETPRQEEQLGISPLDAFCLCSGRWGALRALASCLRPLQQGAAAPLTRSARSGGQYGCTYTSPRGAIFM